MDFTKHISEKSTNAPRLPAAFHTGFSFHFVDLEKPQAADRCCNFAAVFSGLLCANQHCLEWKAKQNWEDKREGLKIDWGIHGTNLVSFALQRRAGEESGGAVLAYDDFPADIRSVIEEKGVILPQNSLALPCILLA